MTDATEGNTALQGGPESGTSAGAQSPSPPVPTPPATGGRPRRERFDALDGLRAVAALAVLTTHVGDASGIGRTLHFAGMTFPLHLAVQQLNLGVEVFFVISAFLVYRPFLAAHVDGRYAHGAFGRDNQPSGGADSPSGREAQPSGGADSPSGREAQPSGGAVEPLRFLWRRAWRIYPAYWVALTAIVAFSYKALSYSGGTNNADLRVAHYLLVWGYDVRWLGANLGLRQAWTLVVEVSFYAFVPLWAWLMRGVGRRIGAMRAEVIGALILVPVSPWMVWNLTVASTPTPLRVLPPFITAFALGMLLAAADVWHERRPTAHAIYETIARHASWAWAVALVAFVLFIKLVGMDPDGIPTAHQQTVERAMHALIAALLVVPAVVGLHRRDGVRRILRWRPLVALGIVSYGFYLWHYVFIDTMQHALDRWRSQGLHTRTVNLLDQHSLLHFGTFFVVALVGAAFMGTVSWFLIERPCVSFAAGRTRWWPTLRDRVRARWRRPRFYTGLSAISIGALAWRVGYVIFERHRLTLSGDAFYYHTQANDIAHGRWFIDPSQYAFYGRITPSAGHPPTYLLYLAGVSKFIGQSELTHRLASTLLGAGAVFFVGVLARMLFQDDRAGWLAAAMAALYAHMWINDEMLMSEGMYQLWTVIAIIAAYRFWRRPQRSTAVWMGAAIGLAALSRAEATTLYPLLVIPLILVLRPISVAQRVKLAAVACAVGALVMSPWVLYNLGRFVHPVVMSNGIGSTIMVANCDLTYKQPYLGYWNVGCAASFPVLQHGDESEKEIEWRKQGVDYITSHLGQQPEMVVLRVARMWDVGFIGQNIFPFNGALEGRGIWQSTLATLQYLLLMPLALHGLVLLRRRKVTIIPFLAVAATITITAAGTFGITRYRAPIDALLPALAAGAVWARLDRSRRAPLPAVAEPVIEHTA